MLIDSIRFVQLYEAQWGNLSMDRAAGLRFLLDKISADEAIKDLRWAAYMLATVKHECRNEWRPIPEDGDHSYFDKYETGTRLGKILGNTQRGDGFRYRGAGWTQITGRGNYAKFAGLLGIDLLKQPELALNPSVSYQIMSLGMKRGLFTGKKLGDYFNETANDSINARKIINGLDKALTISEYHQSLLMILQQSQFS
jgi:putative chitinase